MNQQSLSAFLWAVEGSRLEGVRWQLAIKRYIQEQNYKLGTLVTFSGEVEDAALGTEPFTEASRTLNPSFRGRALREAFATDDYQILLVANKFQTRFDQPLLCGMYVDKRLAGVQAVQTLSRLNRAHPGKDTTTSWTSSTTRTRCWRPSERTTRRLSWRG